MHELRYVPLITCNRALLLHFGREISSLLGCSFNYITQRAARPVQTAHTHPVSCTALRHQLSLGRCDDCSFKAAARLAHAKTSYSGGEQTAATQRKLCFNVIRD